MPDRIQFASIATFGFAPVAEMPGCGARGGATKRKKNLRVNDRFDSVGKLRKKMGRREGEAMVTESFDRIFRSVKKGSRTV